MATTVPFQPALMRIKSRGGRAKENSSISNGTNGQQPAIRLKAVIRHLPSLLKESEFRDSMSNFINDDTTDFFTWVQGKIPEDRNKASTPSRCYVKMKDPMQITALSSALRIHGPFTDSKGNSTLPQMEFSPFQRVPKKTQRIDSRAGTIESDGDFQAFIASLNPTVASVNADGVMEGMTQPPPLDPHAPAPIPANDPLSVPMPSSEPYEKPKTTPLIEYIRSQKSTTNDRLSSSKSKAAERMSSESGRPAKRAERRAREKAAKQKGKEKEQSNGNKSIEPTALLKRADSATPRLARQGSSSLASTAAKAGDKPAEKAGAKEKENIEKGKGRERERRRGGVSGVAAILQRDLGLGVGGSPRRSRGRGTAEPEPTTPVTAAPPASPSTPSAALERPTVLEQQPPDSPARSSQKPRDRPSRRERRAAKLEREESTSSASNTNPVPPSTPVTILRNQSSLNPTPGSPVAMLIKRDSMMTETSSGASSANPSPDATAGINSTSRTPIAPTTPTGPRGNMRGSRGRHRGGLMAVGNSPPPTNPTPPTGPAAGVAHGPGGFGGRGRGGRGGGRGSVFGGGRGRGGPRGGGAPAHNAPPSANTPT